MSDETICNAFQSENFLSRNRTRKKDLKSCENLTELCGYVVDDLELPSEFEWTNADVLSWIGDLGLPQYQNTFKVNLIDGRTLLKIDASALVKMNIKDFDHIKLITNEIRKVFKIEIETFSRSISLPLKQPETRYKFFKISTGPIYELCLRTDFFKQRKLIGQAKVQLNHFEKLHEWLKHIPDFQNVRIGNIKRINLFFVEPNPHRELEAFDEPSKCSCSMPPCECVWSDKEKRQPWRMKFLVEIDEGKYFIGLCVKTL